MPLSADDITTAFTTLSDELALSGERAELVIVGGAALVLLFRARESTKDVDAYFVRPEASTVRTIAQRVADRLDLPPDWLNDGAKGYLTRVSEGELLHSSPSLVVRAASIAQLLGMKLAAWRDSVDRSDARLLLQQMHGTPDEIWAAVHPFVPPHLIDKASYAFEDLWEASRGSR